MARLKEYDTDKVLDKAINVFWTKGYEATSMSELVKATGLNSASMYKEFGNKAQLFEKTIERFRLNAEQSRIKPLLENPGYDALCSFLNSICEYAQSKHFKGCLIMNSVSDMNIIGSSATKAVEKYCMRIEAALENSIRLAQQSGEIPSDKDPVALAHFITCFIQGMTAYGRLSDHKAHIPDLFDQLMAHIRA